jgi:hypothetical protein
MFLISAHKSCGFNFVPPTNHKKSRQSFLHVRWYSHISTKLIIGFQYIIRQKCPPWCNLNMGRKVGAGTRSVGKTGGFIEDRRREREHLPRRGNWLGWVGGEGGNRRHSVRRTQNLNNADVYNVYERHSSDSEGNCPLPNFYIKAVLRIHEILVFLLDDRRIRFRFSD